MLLFFQHNNYSPNSIYASSISATARFRPNSAFLNKGRTNVSQICCCFSNTTIPFDASSIFSNSTFSPKGAITFPAHEYVWLKVKDSSAKPISARRARFVPYYSGAPQSFKNERHASKNSNVNFAHCWSCFQSS